METDLIVVSETVGREIAEMRVDLGRLRRHVDLRMDRLEQASERTRTAVQACQRERSTLTGCAVGQTLADHCQGSRQSVQTGLQRLGLVMNGLSVLAVVLIAIFK